LPEERGIPVKEKIQAVLDEIRPSLKADGGDIELVDVSEDGVVKVKLTGSCGGCPFALMTLRGGIERILKQEVPQVKEVQAIGLTQE
jgi:Fe-S cluster biogenesis protein NfuA